MEKFKRRKSNKSAECCFTEIYDDEKNEIRFEGVIRFKKESKTNKRIMYLTRINNTPAITYFTDKKSPLLNTSAEIEEQYEIIKEKYGIDLK